MKRDGASDPSAEFTAGSLTSKYDLNVEARSPSTADTSVHLLLPDEPPPLTADAARALFRLLLNVHRERRGDLDE